MCIRDRYRLCKKAPSALSSGMKVCPGVPLLSLNILQFGQSGCLLYTSDVYKRQRYNTSYIQGVGIGTISDALSAIKFNVFDNQKFTMKELIDAMNDDFEGCLLYTSSGVPDTRTFPCSIKCTWSQILRTCTS